MSMSQMVLPADADILDTAWHSICTLNDVIPGTGVAARVQGKQIAIFHTAEGVFAVGNRDPFSGANVLARGLLGDVAGSLVVASPVYKQRFCLQTGRCVEEPDVQVPVYPVHVCPQTRHVYVRQSAP